MGQLIVLQTESRRLLQTLAEAKKRSPDLEDKLADLDEDDVLIRVRIDVYTKAGRQFSVKPDNILAGILAPYSLKDAPNTFEHSLFSTCVQPLNRRFIHMLSGLVTNSNPVTTGNMITNDSERAPHSDSGFQGDPGVDPTN